ncbi:hypothetical protein [Aureimonas sp. AU4]|uniref:hypothetical protein n=1 Tax=Aureimonas sp. AU4 TaxID=1638163 RepID=UPI0007856EE2|nr:hypothetical protein [Aureimonas sp. AU4]
MPVKSLLLASASVLLILAPARAQIAAPDFTRSAPAAAPATAAGTPTPQAPNWSVPAQLPAAMPAPAGANPFAAPPAAATPAPVPAPASAPFALAPAPAPPAAVTEPAKPDESALRYYASQRDMARVGAEIRRLKGLYADWQPPSDLFATGPKVDEQPIWDLFAKGDLAGAQAMVASLRTQNQGWQPSDDLSGKLGDAVARQKIMAAAASAAWTDVIAAAQLSPSLLTCEQVDILWTLGEAFARTGHLARSFDAYAYILKTCEDGAVRLATVQKAAQLLPPQGSEALLALGRTGPMGGEFEAVRYDALRGAMGRVASGDGTALPPAAELAAFADFVGRTRSAQDASLFGWYLYGQKRWKDAAGWFRAAGQLTDDPKPLEGLILSLRNDGDKAAASDLAFEARARSPEIAKIYVEMGAERLTADGATPPSDAEQRRFADVVDQARSSLGAQALGWSLVAQNKPEAARGWFAKSVDWEETSEGVLGLAVVASRLKDRAGLEAIKSQYGARYPEVAEIQDTPAAVAKATRRIAAGTGGGQRRGGGGGQDKVLREAQKQFDSGNYQAALASLDEHERKYGRNRGAELLKGWTNLKMRRYQEARAIFKAEDKRGSTKDTRFGIGATFNSQFNAWSSN